MNKQETYEEDLEHKLAKQQSEEFSAKVELLVTKWLAENPDKEIKDYTLEIREDYTKTPPERFVRIIKREQ